MKQSAPRVYRVKIRFKEEIQEIKIIKIKSNFAQHILKNNNNFTYIKDFFFRQGKRTDKK